MGSAMDLNIRELQKSEIVLLKKLISYLNENNIKYFAMGGTLLGAIRHKGFIPWDDDVDIGIPRSDYERLIELLSNGIIPLDYEYSKSAQYYFLRIVDKDIKVIVGNVKCPQEFNLWIDVFPLDGMPNNKTLRFFWKYYILLLREIFHASRFENVRLVKDDRNKMLDMFVKIIDKLKIYKLLNKKIVFDVLDISLKLFPYEKSDYVVNIMGHWKLKELFKKSTYGAGTLYSFEDIKLCGPDDYDCVLSQMYGNYMVPIPLSQRNQHDVEKIVLDNNDVNVN